jgi:hypothetical protein
LFGVAGSALVGCDRVEVGEMSAGARPQELSMVVTNVARQKTSWFLKLKFILIPTACLNNWFIFHMEL